MIALELTAALFAASLAWGVVGLVTMAALIAIVGAIVLRSMPRRARAQDSTARAHV